MSAKQASQKGLQWFQDARFGMFIHWGLYSLIGRGEWVMHWEQIPVSEYQSLMRQFNPVNFNADEWVQLALDAGQRYMVITSRHHDGFSMYNTALSDYKITNTPFKRDPIMELANACTRNGQVKLGFYVSLLDWHHPAYRFREESGLAWDDYVAFVHGQVEELCTQFGDLACIWLDGDWPRHEFNEENAYFKAGGPFEYEKLYDLIHDRQPDAVIQNNRHEKPLPGEDIQGFEQDLPGENTAGFNTETIYDLPKEVCMTINDNWGVHFDDENHKSTRHLIHNLVRAASTGSNYLLNVGPNALGEILPIHKQRLREIGNWLETYGAAIYKTRSGTIPPTREAVCTREIHPENSHKDGKHYVHILEYISDCVALEEVPEAIQFAHMLRDGLPIKMSQRDNVLNLTIPEEYRDPIDTVIVLN
jgi:alpha-L-fucosidase